MLKKIGVNDVQSKAGIKSHIKQNIQHPPMMIANAKTSQIIPKKIRT